MKFAIGDRVVIPEQKSASFPQGMYPAKPGVVVLAFEEGGIDYAELELDDGTYIISAPMSELQKGLD